MSHITRERQDGSDGWRPHTETHSEAVLEISQPAFDEIHAKLTDAGYGHAFIKSDDTLAISMHGIRVKAAGPAVRHVPAKPKLTTVTDRQGVKYYAIRMTQEVAQTYLRHYLHEGPFHFRLTRLDTSGFVMYNHQCTHVPFHERYSYGDWLVRLAKDKNAAAVELTNQEFTAKFAVINQPGLSVDTSAFMECRVKAKSNGLLYQALHLTEVVVNSLVKAGTTPFGGQTQYDWTDSVGDWAIKYSTSRNFKVVSTDIFAANYTKL